jgi:hypothetical protein
LNFIPSGDDDDADEVAEVTALEETEVVVEFEVLITSFARTTFFPPAVEDEEGDDCAAPEGSSSSSALAAESKRSISATTRA